MDVVYLTNQIIRTADGAESQRLAAKMDINWGGKSHNVFAIEMDGGSPLLGVELLADNLITLEMTDGGEVTV